ncbi:triple tyrosine motif-containing protein [Pedobacter sp. SYP-B3415]|uniref:ligand-binding sensor domain-containing protein n=1 Tax=Pedobacter sp. SYP-B3415 TaxID=2496641 RepID=UPI00101D7086|nr:triple tyrosine motif-containing protein [Pedobacter sp. SYP-B3415]
MRLFIIAALLWLGPAGLLAQNQIASPLIINHATEQYSGSVQNWDVAQDRNGVLYFGNGQGLLSYDGNFWNLYKLPNSTVVRSVEIAADNRIYIGGQDEIGYFSPDNRGVLRYHSLLPLIPTAERHFADIWDIVIRKDEVFFRSINLILRYKDGRIQTFKPETEWGFLGAFGDKIIAQRWQKGLMQFENGYWKPFSLAPAFLTAAITSIMPYSRDSLLVSTLKDGLFLLAENGGCRRMRTQIDNMLFKDRIYKGLRINAGQYAIGTTSGGLLIINKSGQLVQRFAYREGLQNNNIRGMTLDRQQNLWLALNDGVDFIAVNSAVKTIIPDQNKQITVYSSRLFNQHLYIGSSNGLYAAKLGARPADLSTARGIFSEVKNSQGQVWNLDELNGQLVMGHEEGFFTVTANQASQVYAYPGTWMFQPYADFLPASQIIAGTYKGLQLIRFDRGKFTNAGAIRGLTESLRFVVLDNEKNIWSSHPYHGIYKIELSPGGTGLKRHTLYTEKDGLPSGLYNYVYRIKNRVVAATSAGVYEYDQKSNRFIPFRMLNEALAGLKLQYLKEDRYGNIWFVTEKKLGVMDFGRPSGKLPFTLTYFPQLNDKIVGGFESVYVLDSANVFVGANKGAYHINYSKYINTIAAPQVALRKVRLFGRADSTLFGGHDLSFATADNGKNEKVSIKLSNELNSLHFEYSTTLFEFQQNTEYSFRLKGFDKKWSAWGKKAETDYTNLSAGSYTFEVRSRYHLGNESAIAAYSFVIMPPWYATWYMKLLYVLIAAGILFQLFKWQRKKHLRARDRLSYLHQLELDRNEKEIVRLQYEKLEADVVHKNKELSTATMHLVEKGKVLSKIKEVLSAAARNNEISQSSTAFRQLVRLIKDVEKGDQDWDHFTRHFNNVNEDFFKKLKAKFPDLTPNELKLCAYLKMNLSSKEIAQLMNITSKAIEVSRYRLRKKLQLDSETNLYDFLLSVGEVPNVPGEQ